MPTFDVGGSYFLLSTYFQCSLVRQELVNTKNVNIILMIKVSLNLKMLDFVWCRKRKSIVTIALTTNCIKKCKVKNRGRVALSTANSPHNQSMGSLRGDC